MLHLLATEPPSVGRHNGDVACRQAPEPREKNRVPPLYLLIGFLPVIGLLFIDWFIPSTRRYKDQTISLTLPQTSVISLVVYFALCSIVH